MKRPGALYIPASKPDYKLVEDEIRQLYNTRIGDLVHILGVVAGLCIMISCLGLLGMATYTIASRVKEISIRKVLSLRRGCLNRHIGAFYTGRNNRRHTNPSRSFTNPVENLKGE